MRLLPLFFFAILLAVVPARAEEEKSLCPTSSYADAEWISDCDVHRQAIKKVVEEFPGKEREMAKELESMSKQNLDSVDLDSGAQCRQAELLTQGLARYRFALTPLKNLDRVLKSELAQKKTRSWKSYYIDVAYPNTARAKVCASKCKDAKCRAVCRWDEKSQKEWDKDIGPQKINPIQFADGMKKEWKLLWKEVDHVLPFLDVKIRDYEQKIASFERSSNAIHAQYRCKGSGIPFSDQVTQSRRGGEKTGAQSGTASSAPSELSGHSVPSGISSAPGGSSGAGTRAAQELFKARTETKEETARKASALLYTQGEFASGSGFYVRTRDQEGKEVYRLLTAHHVPSEEHRNESLPGYLNVNVYGANDQPVQDLTTKAGMSLGYGADASVRYDMDAATFHRGNDVVALPAAPGAALELAPEGELPEYGSELIITGHRGGDGKLVYATIQCQFQGYTPNLLRTDMAYLANCPGAPADIGGMSGGAVLDGRTGRVVGLVSAQNTDKTSRIIVSPLYEAKRGGVGTGPQQQMIQEHCYDSSDAQQSHRCSILPGMQFATH